jgi:hypothetical protein
MTLEATAVHAAAVAAMCGLIWFVQIVHYPLFAAIGRTEFPRYAEAHRRLTSWVVAPVMGVELISAVLVWGNRPGAPAVFGLVVLGLIWLSTAFVQVPLHERLGRGFDAAAAARLVRTNWLRTIGWTVRLGLVLGPLAP